LHQKQKIQILAEVAIAAAVAEDEVVASQMARCKTHKRIHQMAPKILQMKVTRIQIALHIAVAVAVVQLAKV
jgi:hypothetical protein